MILFQVPTSLQPLASGPWSEEEVKGLVNYVRCRGFSHTWPAIKQSEFWVCAATFVSNCVPDHSERTGVYGSVA